ncbi:peptidyl-prolyl cis-trans isomerase [Rhodococcus sp. 14-2496-1d]|uniref:peptidylprolyl isomerase n=1 Tax=Rhodococcus sp. 14-2496-1d TaxID=2023146 RepID=UPI000B9A8AC2|nr:peptidylprolyl isomerase [Rhodococcus sp. 14-2496-1d]OZF26571.1 peptidyl-prolyl cis-trans isomerase [Rhodococcus sp. 14-2496-1d]
MNRTWALTIAISATALVLAGCSGSTEPAAAPATTPSSTTTTTTEAPAPRPALDLSRFGALPPVPQPTTDTVSCSYPEQSPAVKQVTAPATDNVDVYGTVDVTLSTTAGPIGITLDRTPAPCTVNSVVSLVEQGYFDGSPCHRLTTSPGLEVLQCGDPSGSGRGGPGYTFANEYPTTAYTDDPAQAENPVVYPRGTLAMANAGPDTNGSQFFLVYADSVLPPQYTVFGTISDAGLQTLDAIAAGGVTGGSEDGAPATPVIVESATV